MSDNKKYYYMKLKDNFFVSEEMKILASQKNGDAYQLLYMKLSLLSLKNEGRLEFRHGVPYEPEMLSSILDVNIDTVKSGIELFAKLRMIDLLETGVIFMADIQSLIGRGSSEAERKAAYRARIDGEKDNVPQLSHKSPAMSQKRPPELESELKSERETDIPHLREDAVVTLWNEKVCPSVARIQSIPKSRKQKLAVRLSEGMDLAACIEKINASTFLRGEKTNWRVTFDWLVTNDTNWRKVIEGQYDDKKGGPGSANDPNGFRDMVNK